MNSKQELLHKYSTITDDEPEQKEWQFLLCCGQTKTSPYSSSYSDEDVQQYPGRKQHQIGVVVSRSK